MKVIDIEYIVGTIAKNLTIEFTSHGTGKIMMNKSYHRQCIYAQDQWRVYLADKSELNNAEDIEA